MATLRVQAAAAPVAKDASALRRVRFGSAIWFSKREHKAELLGPRKKPHFSSTQSTRGANQMREAVWEWRF